MFAIAGAGGVAAALLAGPLLGRVSVRTALLTGNWLLVAGAPALLLVHSAFLIGMVIALAELLTPLVNAIVSGARVAATPDELQGRVQAAATALSMSLGWLGPLAVGVVFAAAGATATVMLALGWALCLALLTTFVPSLRDGTLACEPAVAEA